MTAQCCHPLCQRFEGCKTSSPQPKRPERVRQFVRWHIDFWHRHVPRHADGTFPNIQVRERQMDHANALDALLSRSDDAAHDYLADCLTFEREIEPAAAPPKADVNEPEFAEAEG